jgi:hypothetical protein
MRSKPVPSPKTVRPGGIDHLYKKWQNFEPDEDASSCDSDGSNTHNDEQIECISDLEDHATKANKTKSKEQDSAKEPPNMNSLSIKQMKQILLDWGVDSSKCVEKSDLVALIKTAAPGKDGPRKLGCPAQSMTRAEELLEGMWDCKCGIANVALQDWCVMCGSNRFHMGPSSTGYNSSKSKHKSSGDSASKSTVEKSNHQTLHWLIDLASLSNANNDGITKVDPLGHAWRIMTRAHTNKDTGVVRY